MSIKYIAAILAIQILVLSYTQNAHAQNAGKCASSAKKCAQVCSVKLVFKGAHKKRECRSKCRVKRNQCLQSLAAVGGAAVAATARSNAASGSGITASIR